MILVLMSSLITLITPIMYENRSFRREYATNNPNGTCITKGKKKNHSILLAAIFQPNPTFQTILL